MATKTAQARSCYFRRERRPCASKLLPSLYQLEKAGQLNPDTRIIGVGRADWDKAAYNELSARRSKLS
ncbi:hypothetical protein ACLB1T_29885 [Escherichia coli]